MDKFISALRTESGGISAESVRRALDRLKADERVALITTADEDGLRMLAHDHDGHISDLASRPNHPTGPALPHPLQVGRDEAALTTSLKIKKQNQPQKEEQDPTGEDSPMTGLLSESISLSSKDTRTASRLRVRRKTREVPDEEDQGPGGPTTVIQGLIMMPLLLVGRSIAEMAANTFSNLMSEPGIENPGSLIEPLLKVMDLVFAFALIITAAYIIWGIIKFITSQNKTEESSNRTRTQPGSLAAQMDIYAFVPTGEGARERAGAMLRALADAYSRAGLTVQNSHRDMQARWISSEEITADMHIVQSDQDLRATDIARAWHMPPAVARLRGPTPLRWAGEYSPASFADSRYAPGQAALSHTSPGRKKAGQA